MKWIDYKEWCLAEAALRTNLLTLLGEFFPDGPHQLAVDRILEEIEWEYLDNETN